MEEKRFENGELTAAIADQTSRALWEVGNVIACVPDRLWEKEYCEQPLYKHIYHMLHSLDLWFINPWDPAFCEPSFHIAGLNNLDLNTDRTILRGEIDSYFSAIEEKIKAYTVSLTPERLLEQPEGCRHSRFRLILGQFRHLHTHLGMLMGWIIAETGEWPLTVGLEHPVPEGKTGIFAEDGENAR